MPSLRDQARRRWPGRSRRSDTPSAPAQPAADDAPATGSRPTDEPVRPSAVLGGDADHPAWWAQRPQRVPFRYPSPPLVQPQHREMLQHLLAGRFQPGSRYPALDIGVPPGWKDNPLDDRGWDFQRHNLEWLEPLVGAWLVEHDPTAARIVGDTLRSWAAANRPRPVSRQARSDHAVAVRLRMLCWMLEHVSRRDDVDMDFLGLLVCLIDEHARCAADDDFHNPTSNHGLELDASLLAAAITLPEHPDADAWRRHATTRLVAYVDANFSPVGFHLEQSPTYHSFVLHRLAGIAQFLHSNGEAVPEAVWRTIQRAAAVWAHLRRVDGSVPTIGDSVNPVKPAAWRERLARDLGPDAVPAPARSTVSNPRDDGACMLVDPVAGYAIFAADPGEPPAFDAHVVLRCNTFPFTHWHRDHLSVTVFAAGRDWVVDPGFLNYEEHRPERRFLRSATAHAGVVIDDEAEPDGPVVPVELSRDAGGDTVGARFYREALVHTRWLRAELPQRVVITDHLEPVDGRRHTARVQLPLAPDLEVAADAGHATVTAPDGTRLVITADGPPGSRWAVTRGQREPVLAGWFSPAYGEFVPAALLSLGVGPFDGAVTVRVELALPPARR